MKTLKKEIENFVNSISKKEMRKNPKLAKKAKALLFSLKVEASNDLPTKSKDVLKYLNKKTLL